MRILTLKGPAFLALLWISFVIAKGLGWLLQRALTKGSGDITQAKNFTASEIGFLRGGPRAALETIFVAGVTQHRIKLSENGMVKLDKSNTAAIDDLLQLDTPLGDQKSAQIETLLRASGAADAINTKLVREGFVLSAQRARWAHRAPLILMVPVFALGVAKIFHAITLGKPSMFLLISLFVFIRLSSSKKVSRLTRSARSALAVLETRYAALLTTAFANADLLDPDDQTLAFAIAGSSALTGDSLKPLKSGIEKAAEEEHRIYERESKQFDDFYGFDCATPVIISSGSSCSSCSSCGGCGGCGGCG